MSRGYITSGTPSAKGGAPAHERPYSINDGETVKSIVQAMRNPDPITFRALTGPIAPQPRAEHIPDHGLGFVRKTRRQRTARLIDSWMPG